MKWNEFNLNNSKDRTSWSQWPLGLRHEMSSPAWILESWVPIPLEAWMFVCVYPVFVLSCVGSGLATGWSLVQGVLPIIYKYKISEPHKGEAKARYGLQRHIRRRRKTEQIVIITVRIHEPSEKYAEKYFFYIHEIQLCLNVIIFCQTTVSL
jgi:hypothetical protein